MINKTFQSENNVDPLWVVCESEEQMRIFRDFIISHRPKADCSFAYWDSSWPMHAYAYILDTWFAKSGCYGIDHLCLKWFPKNEEFQKKFIGFLDWYNQISPVFEDDKLSDIGDLL